MKTTMEWLEEKMHDRFICFLFRMRILRLSTQLQTAQFGEPADRPDGVARPVGSGPDGVAREDAIMMTSSVPMDASDTESAKLALPRVRTVSHRPEEGPTQPSL